MVETLADLRFAARRLTAGSAASLPAIAVLAIGIGIATAMWSVLDGVALRGLPFPDGRRVVTIAFGDGHDAPMAAQDFLALRERQRSFEEVAALRTFNSVITRDGGGSRGLTASYVTGNLLSMLGVEPELGRGFTLDDEDPARPPVAILSHHAWRDHFRSDPRVIGQTVVLNRETMTVVGVMPDGFRFPIRQDAWASLRFAGRPWSDSPVFAIGKLGADLSPRTAESMLRPLVAELEGERPLERGREILVRSYVPSVLPEAVRRSLEVMVAAVLGLLLLACANAAQLRLADVAGRRAELAVRRVLGAGRGRLVRMLVVEGALVAGLGAVAGLGLAWGLVRLASGALLEGSLLPRQFWVDVRLDQRALLFAVTAALVSTVLAGLLPSMKALFGRRGHAPGGSPRRAGWILVATQVAICFALLLGAGVLVDSGLDAIAKRPASEPTNLARTLVSTYQADLRTAAQRRGFWEQLLDRLASGVEVDGAAIAGGVPWGAPYLGARLVPEEAPSTDRESWPAISFLRVTPGFFELLGLPLLSGRPLEARDLEASDGDREEDLPAVVSAGFAARHLESPVLGRRFHVLPAGASRTVTLVIVGVVPDRGRDDDASAADAQVYAPWSYAVAGSGFLIYRARTDFARARSEVDREIERIDPLVATLDHRTYAQDLAEETWVARRLTQLFLVFGAAALALSALGLHGVAGRAVTERRRELAIRSALGAFPFQLRHSVWIETGRWLALGLGLGGLIAGSSHRFLSSLIDSVEPWNGFVVLVALAVALAVLGAAVQVPASRAARADPAGVLRAE